MTQLFILDGESVKQFLNVRLNEMISVTVAPLRLTLSCRAEQRRYNGTFSDCYRLEIVDFENTPATRDVTVHKTAGKNLSKLPIKKKKKLKHYGRPFGEHKFKFKFLFRTKTRFVVYDRILIS